MFVLEPSLGIMPRPDKWVLRSPAIWKSADLELTIPAGFVTDLASIPRLVRNLLDVDGRSRLPAILHDWLYSGQFTTRTFADAQLRDALMAYGESIDAAFIYWAGVRAGGWLPWLRVANQGGGLQLDDFIDQATFAIAKSMPRPVLPPRS